MFNHRLKIATTSLVGVVGLGIGLLGAPEVAKAVDIQLGADYFTSPKGGSSTRLPDGTVVPLAGIPILLDDPNAIPGLPDWADTKVERQEDCTFVAGECAIPIEMTELHLRSIDPVNIGGFDYYVTSLLDPANPTVGEMTIRESGTFDSFMEVFVEISFDPIDGGVALPNVFDNFTLTQTNAPWSHTPADTAVLVNGVEGDQAANCHDAPNTLGGDCADTDFFTNKEDGTLALVEHKKGSPGFPDLPNGHDTAILTDPPIVNVNQIPEPSSTLGLIAVGIGGLFGAKRKKDQK